MKFHDEKMEKLYSDLLCASQKCMAVLFQKGNGALLDNAEKDFKKADRNFIAYVEQKLQEKK